MGRIKECILYIYRIINREKVNILLSLVFGVIITMAFAINSTRIYAEDIQGDIAKRVVRFHVLANSDSKEDQELKLKVRDTVLEAMNEKLSDCATTEESTQVIKQSLTEIKKLAESVILEEGYSYDVEVYMSNDLFPQKKYGDVVFPAGMYDALRINIGNAEGANWWCVMFPPLCFVEAGKDDLAYESKEQLKNVLTDEEFEIVTSKKCKSLAPKVKFKVVEIWQSKKYSGEKFVTKS